MAALTPTVDPDVFIEASGSGYVRYWRASDLRRWEVHGACTHLGFCVVGGVLTAADGDVVEVEDLEHLDRLLAVPKWRAVLKRGMDTPVTPEFEGCCPLTFRELPAGEPQPE